MQRIRTDWFRRWLEIGHECEHCGDSMTSGCTPAEGVRSSAGTAPSGRVSSRPWRGGGGATRASGRGFKSFCRVADSANPAERLVSRNHGEAHRVLAG